MKNKQFPQIIFFIIIFFHPLAVLSVEKNLKKDAQSARDSAQTYEKQAEVKYFFSTGVHYSPVFPLSNMKDVFENGWGMGIILDYQIPRFSFFKIGFSLAYTRITSKEPYFVGNLALVPAFFYTEFFYRLGKYITPHLRLGLGETFAFYKGRVLSAQEFNRENSNDFTLSAGIGLGFAPKDFKRVEFLASFNYFFAYERQMRDYAIFSVGSNIKY